MPTSRVVSVVVPAFNHERFVGEALQSVRRQSLIPGEVVVVDDGSTDGTAAVVEGAEHPGLTLLRQQNSGAHAALNRAIAHARGPWIAILNSDDAFLSFRVENALGVAQATGAALVVGRVRLIDDAGEPLSPDHPTSLWYRDALHVARTTPRLLDALRVHNAAVTTSNFFLHKELWRRMGGFRPYRYVHDYDFLLRAVSAAPTRVVFEDALDGVAYRVHGANTISDDVDRALRERADMLLRHRRPMVRAVSWVKSPATRRALAASFQDGRCFTPSSSGTPAPNGAPGLHIRCGLVVNELDAGGLEEVVSLLATGLPDHGVEPHVLCSRSGGRIARRLARAGVPVTVARTRSERLQWLRNARPEVLSTHFTPVEILTELGEADVPMVETIHNAYVWFSSEDWQREGEKQRWLQALAVVSAGAAAYYQARVGAGCAPMTVIPNGVAPDRALTVPGPFARRVLGLPPDAAVLLQLGRIDAPKNQRGLVTAFREVAHRHPECVLALAGSASDPEYLARLRADHADLLAAGRVRLFPPRSDVGTLLSAADAYVSNSWFEGWSLGASEALWTGLPLMLSDTGGSREMAGERGERGYVIPNPLADPLELGPAELAHGAIEAGTVNLEKASEALDHLLRSRDTWMALRPEIRAWARSHLAASRVTQAYAGFLRGVLAGRTGPG